MVSKHLGMHAETINKLKRTPILKANPMTAAVTIFLLKRRWNAVDAVALFSIKRPFKIADRPPHSSGSSTKGHYFMEWSVG